MSSASVAANSFALNFSKPTFFLIRLSATYLEVESLNFSTPLLNLAGI
jgi:hypothetical protein